MSDYRYEPWTGRPTEFGDLSPFTLERTEFRSVSDAPVHCFPVTLRGQLIGYLWGSETTDAADFCPRRGMGAAGWDARGPWRRRLKEARDAGFSAWEAVRYWVGEPEDPRGGGVAADAEGRVLPDSRGVQRLASQAVDE
ncbi:hypothetical protein SBI_04319 [Streptomyces bingchenggensis BCW-1]|uniref:Uncharacterized protein n=1 Tax=Streptomyces bingchenggensis (strain BCW-1) TaxID=749414 RepID=D7BTK0_STRBB|nr:MULTISPECIES: hypothetical protein [Streptomyces]ADI07439.1 hypothetical protein SBI_04319 [Streptomyces bingchenggensis BCW-1]